MHGGPSFAKTIASKKLNVHKSTNQVQVTMPSRVLHKPDDPLVWVTQGRTEHLAYLLPTPAINDDNGDKWLEVVWEFVNRPEFVPQSSIRMVDGSERRHPQPSIEGIKESDVPSPEEVMVESLKDDDLQFTWIASSEGIEESDEPPPDEVTVELFAKTESFKEDDLQSTWMTSSVLLLAVLCVGLKLEFFATLGATITFSFPFLSLWSLQKVRFLLNVTLAQKATYRKLQEGKDMVHTVVYLRNNVAHDLNVPFRYFVNRVWPAVMKQVEEDSRVKKNYCKRGGRVAVDWRW